MATISGALTVEEARRLLGVLHGHRLEALYVTALTVGLRRGELLGLRWQDIDFDAGTLTVRQTVQRAGGRLEFAEPKTDRSRRTVPVPAPRSSCCGRTDGARPPIGSQRGSGGPITAWSSRLGSARRSSRNLDRSWHALRAQAGLDWLRIHDLRHACATFMLASGASPRTVPKMLGHSQIGLTMNTYAHVLPEIERAAVDAATDRLFG